MSEEESAEAPMGYAEKVKRLEEIIEKLEQGKLDLAEMLALVEEGSRLQKSCKRDLEEAEGKLKEISLQVEASED